MPPTDSDEKLSTALLDDHRELEAMMRDVAAATETSDRATVQSSWSRFEPALLHHMDWEEAALLPGFERAHPIDAARFRADHARLREQLTDIGIRIDLRSARAEDIEAFLAALRAHSEAENRLVYAWADATIEPPIRHDLLAAFRARLSGLSGDRAVGSHHRHATRTG